MLDGRGFAGCTVAAVLLAGCSSSLPSRFIHPPADGDVEGLIHGGEPPALDDVDVLALPPAAEAWLEAELGPAAPPTADTVRRLAAAFDTNGSLAMRYEPLGAYTAAEAFVRRAGNCLAHAHLFIALARARGINASYREVLQAPEWNRHGDVMVWSRHVGAHVDVRRHGTFHVDFAGQAEAGSGFGRRIRDDLARAQHFNNLGAAALLRDASDEGIRAFRRSLSIEPSLSYVWSNLGLALRRRERKAEAEWALRHAVSLDRFHFPALYALENFYRHYGDEALATAFAGLAENAKWEHPFRQYQLGVNALANKDARAAVNHLQAAARGLPEQLPIQLELARAFFAAKRMKEAQKALEAAAGLVKTRGDKMRLARTIDELERRHRAATDDEGGSRR